MSGTELWRQVINGSLGFVDRVLAVTVDGAGNVVAVGWISNTGTFDDFAVIKFDSVSGMELWRQEINGTANSVDAARAVAVDGEGDVVAAGTTLNVDTGEDFTVVKLDGASGDELWRQEISGTDGNAFASTVAVDGVGNVVASGFTQNIGTFRDFTVVKLGGTNGAELWRQVINGSANDDDEAFAVTVDGAGNVVAAGYLTNMGTSRDFIVVKFDGTSGGELWRQVINGTANGDDMASAIAVHGAGNVLAVGSTRNTGSADDFTVIKLSGADGTELWRQDINGTVNGGDEAFAVTMDPAGDVVAAGLTGNVGTFGDLTVVKLDGAGGAELWRQTINGTANDFDEALAVAVDGAGDVVAAGRTRNTGTGVDFTVVKLRGIDGSDF